jgi:hypothetical protein
LAIQSFKRSTLTNNQKYRGFLAGNPPGTIPLSFVVIAGGGAAGYNSNPAAGTGGAGGYRSSWNNELSGGNGAAEALYATSIFTPITVTVGAGGLKKVNPNESGAGADGSPSVLGAITTVGGGGGGGAYQEGKPGGSGGGGGYLGPGGGYGDSGAGTANQGFAGGQGGNQSNGEGGGAGAKGRIGQYPIDNTGRTSVGRASTITGTSVVRANGSGGPAANTGNGGFNSYDNQSGGTGVVIIRYPAVFNVTVGAGLTATTTFPNLNEKITIFTAGTGTVSFG